MASNNANLDQDREFFDVKMKTTGLGAMIGHLQQNKDQLEEETKPDHNSMWNSNLPLDQLCDIGHGLPKSFRSQRISAYYCETCEVDLNSAVTYNTHIIGAKHKKKEKNKALIRESKLQENSASSSLQPPKPKKSKKNVIDFRELVRESEEPVIGLQYIVEMFPESSSGEDDAMYSCGLCCCDSTAASMFAHVKGFKHREKYLGMKYNLTTDDKKTVLFEAKRVEGIEGRRLNEVDTIFDDHKYPWPPGRRPAHLERESSAEKKLDLKDLLPKDMGSLSRDFSRRGYNFEKHRVEENKVKLTNSAVAQVLECLQASKVKDEDDAEMAHQVAAHLMRALSEYKQLTGDPRESSLIKLRTDQILEILHEVVMVPSISKINDTPTPVAWKGDVVDYGHGQQPNDDIRGGVSSSYDSDIGTRAYRGHTASASEREAMNSFRVTNTNTTSSSMLEREFDNSSRPAPLPLFGKQPQKSNPTTTALYGDETFTRPRSKVGGKQTPTVSNVLDDEEEEYRKYMNRMSAERSSNVGGLRVPVDVMRVPVDSSETNVGFKRSYSDTNSSSFRGFGDDNSGGMRGYSNDGNGERGYNTHGNDDRGYNTHGNDDRGYNTHGNDDRGYNTGNGNEERGYKIDRFSTNKGKTNGAPQRGFVATLPPQSRGPMRGGYKTYGNR